MRWMIGVVATALTLGFSSSLWAGDWPAYRHDSRRSGATAENLPAEKLSQAWAYRSAAPPQPAWDGLHPIRVIFADSTGGEALRVSYQGPGIDKQEIPDSVLLRPSRGDRR